MIVANEQPFDFEVWLKRHRDVPSMETLKAFAGFTLMVNLFEARIFPDSKRVKYESLEQFSREIGYGDEHIQTLTKCVDYYQLRYRPERTFNDAFEKLKFGTKKCERYAREHVESVLNGEKESPSDQMFAMLIIVYRIRNNTFHGDKSINTWDDQASNISHAAKVLALALEAKGALL